MISPRAEHHYISPEREVNAGLWTLFSGATLFLSLRLWCKLTRGHGLWYDDHILVISWIILLMNDALISYEFATGYVVDKWDDRMHILINISSCGTLLGQTWTKTAFAVTLLRMSNRWQQYILWFCIATMNAYMAVKMVFQWARYCDEASYQVWYRIPGFCINATFADDFKEGGNTYNIIMDFVFALFPWLITWRLNIKRYEKAALCVTMSLGLLVAIISAVRTVWKSKPIMHVHDAWYMWRNGQSMVWYSAEICGTIIVQCIPILRPFLREIHSSLTSRKLGDTEAGRTTGGWRSNVDGKRASSTITSAAHDDTKKAPVESFALRKIPEEAAADTIGQAWEPHTSYSPSEVDRAIKASHTGPLQPGDGWPLSAHTDVGSHVDEDSHYEPWAEPAAAPSGETALWPPPRRPARV
ncbi:uncharacterized protein BCR38DRAFT_390532 [Pseudomassariella vexata]|uniref:Rhodopsin domain-containing protein n=1 Tax=Pseudomassariella vexata TaxID=1141098 RepID=A0A1Y2DZS3_9PEZI|nr:uncharacterized protein BCR38DRAFT_390532 [Pseudomassariella vexata]ORY64783.1 hypothetical protein BCR38DRAFT_390532 [Pseudomassariella vexata]